LVHAIGDVMMTFGISATAAKFHVKNIANLEVAEIPVRDLPPPPDEWIGRENFTVDWFPLKSTPISRRGRFALLVALAFREGLISSDTAATYLRCLEVDFLARANDIISAHL
jgi:hypothetical protein